MLLGVQQKTYLYRHASCGNMEGGECAVVWTLCPVFQGFTEFSHDAYNKLNKLKTYQVETGGYHT